MTPGPTKTTHPTGLQMLYCTAGSLSSQKTRSHQGKIEARFGEVILEFPVNWSFQNNKWAEEKETMTVSSTAP